MPRRANRLGTQLATLFTGALLAAGGAGLAIETVAVFESKAVPQREWPSSWLPGAPRLDRLSAFVDQARALLPDDASVAVASDVFQPNDMLAFRMWCAYFLPRQQVVDRDRLGEERPAYLLSYPGLYGEPPGTKELLRDSETSLHLLK